MKAERGFALILVLILLGLGAFIIGPALSLANTALQSRGILGQDIKHDYAAASGIAYAIWRIQWEPGYRASLPIGQESLPFQVTINGVTVTIIILPQAPPGQLSGQALAGPAANEIYFKVTKDVVPTSIVTPIATDGFESGGVSGGTGAWLGPWSFSGDSSMTGGGGPYDGAYHLRLRGDNDASPGPGYAQRAVNLSSSSGAGPYLQFWAKLKDLESGDTVQVRVSTDGTNWAVLRTFDQTDSDDTYRFYEYNLSSYGTPASFFVSFQAIMNNTDDQFFVDKLWFANTQGSATPTPGVVTQYTYYVSIQCMDPDGCRQLISDAVDPDLEEIRDELPKRGATSGDYLQYIPNSVSWDPVKWGVAPFEPTTNTLGSGSSLQQELRWVFNPNVKFDYGEIKTMSFQAQAALTQGVYCNRIWVRPDKGDLRSGNKAKIIVGNPADTRCSGGLLEVDKTVDPLVIYPDVPTTLTYTITIKNVDTIPVEIAWVEDYLPATGFSTPTFVYVDNSTHAFINRQSLPLLFQDSFNRPNNNTVLYWTDGDGVGDNCRVNGNMAQLRGLPPSGCAITQSSISTVGYTTIVLTYRWTGNNTEAGDKLLVEWKPSSSGTWNTLVEHSLNQTNWQNASWSLPTAADNTTIDIRFTGRTDATDEWAQLDDVKVKSNVPIPTTPVCMPDQSGNNFFTKTWLGGATLRWRLQWQFVQYPNANDPVWNINDLCGMNGLAGGTLRPLGGYEWANYNPMVLQPGEILTIIFKATVTLTASGSYLNEVFVKLDAEINGTDLAYSWPTGGVSVPEVDIKAQTPLSLLRANALFQATGMKLRSWHWKTHR